MKAESSDCYRIRRERIALKLDALIQRHDLLAADDPERGLLMDQIWALNIAYCVEE
jgi:hypothetical protein